MMIIGVALMFQGVLLLIGEYLCVEVAWRCVDYNQYYTGLGALLMGTGLITTMVGVNDH